MPQPDGLGDAVGGLSSVRSVAAGLMAFLAHRPIVALPGLAMDWACRCPGRPVQRRLDGQDEGPLAWGAAPSFPLVALSPHAGVIGLDAAVQAPPMFAFHHYLHGLVIVYQGEESQYPWVGFPGAVRIVS